MDKNQFEVVVLAIVAALFVKMAHADKKADREQKHKKVLVEKKLKRVQQQEEGEVEDGK